MYTEMIIVITLITWVSIFGLENRMQRSTRMLSRRVDEIEKTLDDVIEALHEDAALEYEYRIEKMFDFLTKGLDPEDET